MTDDPTALHTAVKKARYERPSRKNPYRLTINQHAFPAASITRFCSSTDYVDVVDLKRQTRRPAKTRDDIFCAKRCWDHRSENGFMREIENRFQVVARRVIEDPESRLDADENVAVTRMYALWRTRAYVRLQPHEDLPINGIVGSERPLTKDEEEILEANGIIFIRNTGSPRRFYNGLHCLQFVDQYIEAHPNMIWSPWTAYSGEFVVPDYTLVAVLPLTPALVLTEASRPARLRRPAMRTVNRHLLEDAELYYFAHNLSKCPGIATRVAEDLGKSTRWVSNDGR